MAYRILAYEDFYQKGLPVPIKFLREMLCLILQENSFQFHGIRRNYLKTHCTAMAAKMVVAFANIFMAQIENEIRRQSPAKLLVWKQCVTDVFSLWNATWDKIESFISKANDFHSPIKSTAEISETRITFVFSWQNLDQYLGVKICFFFFISLAIAGVCLLFYYGLWDLLFYLLFIIRELDWILHKIYFIFSFWFARNIVAF